MTKKIGRTVLFNRNENETLNTQFDNKSHTVWTKIENIFRSIFCQPDLVLKNDLTAWDLPEWDSLRHLQIILKIEKEFDIKFSTPEILNLNNVEDLFVLVLKKTFTG